MAISKWCATKYPPKYIEYVYSLRCPIDYEIFYVGKTIHPKERLNAHISESLRNINNSPSKKEIKIQSIVDCGLKPIMFLIDKTEIRTNLDKMFALHKEVYWIRFYLSIGWNLLNISSTQEYALCGSDYSIYLRDKKYGGYEKYYFGIDHNGDKIYDNKKITNDGFHTPYDIYQKQLKEELSYKPFENERFRIKNGLEVPNRRFYEYEY